MKNTLIVLFLLLSPSIVLAEGSKKSPFYAGKTAQQNAIENAYYLQALENSKRIEVRENMRDNPFNQAPKSELGESVMRALEKSQENYEVEKQMKQIVPGYRVK